MKFEIGKTYILSSKIVLATPSISGDDVFYHRPYDNWLIQFTKIEIVNELFTKYNIIRADQIGREIVDNDKYILVCNDEKYFAQLPQTLLYDKIDNSGRRCYLLKEVESLVFSPTDKYIKLTNIIEGYTSQYNIYRTHLKELLREEAVDSRGCAMDRNLYENEVDNFTNTPI